MSSNCLLYTLLTNRSEEMEDLKRKMNAKLQDLEEQLEAAQSRASQLEKTKTRLQGELEDTMVEVDRVRFLMSSRPLFDKIVLRKKVN